MRVGSGLGAKDGPHRAGDVKMDGRATYKLTYRLQSSEANGFLRYVDTETAWGLPFTVTFGFLQK